MLDRRLDVAEAQISNIEDGTAQSLKRLESVERILKDMAIKNEDLEACSRRNTISILGVPETVNTGRLDLFVESLLTDMFGREQFTPGFVVERAHCTLGPRPIPGCPPRHIIARIMNFRDTALRLARVRGDTIWQGSKLSLSMDFTLMVQEARRKYNGVKATRRILGLKYGMRYPARLRVDVNGRARIFTTPTVVQEFCHTYKHKDSRTIADGAGNSPPCSGSNASVELFSNNGTG